MAILSKDRPTVMAGTPGFFRGYLRKSVRGDFSSVRLLVSGADRCPDMLRREFLEKHGLTLYEGYGATETSPVISTNTPEHNRPRSVGKVLPSISARIENHETGRECRTGKTGGFS